jgi:predicted metalloprotease with PDZ domain
MKKVIILLLISFNIYAQDDVFHYELDFTKKNDAFNITLSTPQLSKNDSVYSFVSYAPGVHQPLDFGRFVKMFKVYDKEGNELITNKISINEFEILEPTKVSSIIYEIDDSIDMSTNYHPIYPMSGTGINSDYIIINPHGVFGYFINLKNNAIVLHLKLDGNPKIGTALNMNAAGNYEIDSFYHLTDSPILIGDKLSYASTKIDEIEVEAYVYSPSDKITAQMVLDEAKPILNAAEDFIGYSPVDRYTLLMYFASESDVVEMPVFRSGGALEHSLSSTYALPDMPQYLPLLKNIIAHEFMHILSPLHLHSNILANFNYSNPVSEDNHVWLYEGVTEWVSYMMQFKSGIVTFDDYLNYLSEKTNNSKKYSDAYSLTRISREWSTDEGNKQYGNIYQLGALTAAMLDIKLIELSNGEKNLREIYIDLIKKYGKDKPFDNDDFFDVLVAMTYPEISDFIDKHIINNTPFNFEQEMNAVGISYYDKQLSNNNLPTMGVNIEPNSMGLPVIVEVSSDYGGSLLKEGDVISRINDVELNRSTYHEIMKNIGEMEIGEDYEIDIVRNGQEMKVTEKLYPKYDRNVFEVDQTASGKSKKLQEILMAPYE